jgi:endonuclease YncB( thermonuclease family)
MLTRIAIPWLAFAFAQVLPFADPSHACSLPTTSTNTVAAIADGRTLQLDDGSLLRLTSIIAPTPYDSPAATPLWPSEGFARQALSASVLGRNVEISLERGARDRYGRHVGHALLPAEPDRAPTNTMLRWLQARMVRDGQARVDLTPELNADCSRHLLALEAEAERARRGLWKHAIYQPKRAEDTIELLRYRSTFHIVEGVIQRVAARRSVVYLNFGNDWRKDFTAKISRMVLKKAGLAIEQITQQAKVAVRIRGWLERRNGPLITVWRAEQIELLSLSTDGSLQRYHPPRLLSDLTSHPPGRRPAATSNPDIR